MVSEKSYLVIYIVLKERKSFMLEKKITVQNETGIHARAASLLVREATKFIAESYIIKDGNQYNCKSIMSIMSMGARKGENIHLKVIGADEEEAFQALTDLIEKRFCEDE